MVRRIALLLFTLCITLISTTVILADILPQVRDGFRAANPKNGWEYGFLDDNGNFISYNTTFDDGKGIAGWALNNTPGPEGDVTLNYTDQPIDRYGVHWESGQILLHTPMHGKGVVVRWTASNQSNIKLDTSLTPQPSGLNANIELWAGNTKLIDKKQTDISTDLENTAKLDSQTATSDTVENSSTVSLKAGDEIRLIIAPASKMFSSHIGIALTIGSVNDNGTVTAKSSIGMNTLSRKAKVASKKYTTTVAKNGVQK